MQQQCIWKFTFYAVEEHQICTLVPLIYLLEDFATHSAQKKGTPCSYWREITSAALIAVLAWSILKLGVEARSFFRALARPEEVHMECNLRIFWRWNTLRCSKFSLFSFALQSGTYIASDRSLFYCSHMTWVKPCGLWKKESCFAQTWRMAQHSEHKMIFENWEMSS